MLRHEKTHTDKEPFSCTNCEFKCNQKAVLKDHIIKNHGESSKEEKKEEEEEEKEEPKPGNSGPKHTKSEEQIGKKKEEPGKSEPCQTNFVATKLDNGKWKCPCCPYSSKNKFDVNKHIRLSHLGNISFPPQVFYFV